MGASTGIKPDGADVNSEPRILAAVTRARKLARGTTIAVDWTASKSSSLSRPLRLATAYPTLPQPTVEA